LKIKQYIILFCGLTLMAAAVALAKIASLGTSPIASIPNVLSFLTDFSIGNLTIAFSFFLVLCEAIVLREYFSWRNFLQLIPGVLFGAFIDFFTHVFQFIQLDHYFSQLLLTFVSIGILACGVFLEVKSATVVMPGEGIAAAIAFRFKKPFAIVKVRSDFTMVLVAILLSLVFTQSWVGVREGTILSALFAGKLVGVIDKYFGVFFTY